MENLTMRPIRRQLCIQSQRSRITNTMPAHERPVGIRLIGQEWECEVCRAEFGFCGRDGGAHEAGGCVD